MLDQNQLKAFEVALLKSAGQRAYEEELRYRPLYVDKTPKPTWANLSCMAQESWEFAATPQTRLAEGRRRRNSISG